MAWYDEIDHVKVTSSIPKSLADDMDKVRGKYNRSRYLRMLIEADVQAKTEARVESESAA